MTKPLLCEADEKTFQSLWLFIRQDIAMQWTRLTQADLIYIDGEITRLATVVTRRYSVDYSLALSTTLHWFNNWRNQAIFRMQLK